MTEPKDMPPDDRELDEFLARRSALSRRYREALPPEAAPSGLDRRVLDQARQELRRAGRGPRRLWQQHFATAAAVLLVAGLAWMVRQQQFAPPQSVPAAASESMRVSAPAAPPAPAPAAPAPAAAQAAEAKPMHGPSQQQQARKAQKAAPAVPAVPPPALASPAPDTVGKPAASMTMSVPAAAPEPESEQPSVSGSRDLAASPPAQAERNAAAPAAPAYAPPAAGYAAPAPAPGVAKAAETVPAACGVPQRAAAELQTRPELSLDSAAWLAQIRRLQTADATAARAELACFAAARPQEGVPDDLRALLPVSH